MRIFALNRAFYKLSREGIVKLSEQAQVRLAVVKRFETLRERGFTSQQAAEFLVVSRATLYRWRRALARHGPRGLEPGSRRPHRVRQAHRPQALLERLESLREEEPSWGKGQLTVLLHGEGFSVSESTVGRILSRWIEKGKIQTVASLSGRHTASRRMRRWHASRLPKGAARPQVPGERLEVDTLHVTVEPGRSVKHFSAICPVSRWACGEVYSRATAYNASRFLDELVSEAPFPVQSIQVDGGAEFMADFEAACAAKGIPLYVLPPRSPKMNAHVERMQLTWRRELYEARQLPARLDLLRPIVKQRQHFYNHQRPHSALDKKSPIQYLANFNARNGPPSHM
ncbi:MAG TPA: integrase core domain-containing protein [Thermoanaerobaculia bacterium]|nr:integrase core domain-containing protein [Thermoanaerobaculia bacterium]